MKSPTSKLIDSSIYLVARPTTKKKTTPFRSNSDVKRYDANGNLIEIIPAYKAPIRLKPVSKQTQKKAEGYAKELKCKATPEEIAILRRIKPKCEQLGLKCLFQHIIHWNSSFYILDIYISKIKLCVEIDGAHHYQKHQLQKDEKRTKYLKQLGIKVVRYSNDRVSNAVYEVVGSIMSEVKRRLRAISQTNKGL